MNEDSQIAALAKVQTIEDLVGLLKSLHQAAGLPSMRDIEGWANKNDAVLSRTSVNDVLNGRRPSAALLDDLLRCFSAKSPGNGTMSKQERDAWQMALSRLPRPSRPGREEGLGPAERFFTQADDVEEVARLIREAKAEVWLLGTTLSKHIPFLDSYIQHALGNGVQFKILLIERDGAAMAMAHLRAGPTADLEEMQERLDINLSILASIARRAHGRMEVRLIDYLAPYTLYAYDPTPEGDGDGGRMDLRLGSFHGAHDLRPTFIVEKARDNDWFGYFYREFMLTWNKARPVDQ